MADENIVKRIRDLIPILQKTAMGDFSGKINIPKEEDELTELLVALSLMMDDLKELNRENREMLKSLKEKVEKRAQEIQKSEEKYRILYESSRDAIMILAPPSWNFTSGNPSTIVLFNTKDESDFISRPPWEYSPKYQLDGQLSRIKAKKMIDKAMKGGSNFFEWRHKKIGGKEFPASVLLTKIKISGKDLLQATVRDLSDVKGAEEKLEQKIKELEKINGLMVGRELRMKELKEKIIKLEKRNV